MRSVWNGADSGDNLVTNICPPPHTLSEALQEEAFDFLDHPLKP
jgi:hypothetical protein